MNVHIFFLSALLLVAATTVAAQTITGVVVDGNGATIAGAVVTFSNNNSKIQSSTDTEGRFSIVGQITNGSRLAVKADGFAPFERELKNDGVWDFTIILLPEQITSNVVVSVARTDTRLSETPASIVVLTRDNLDSSAAQTLDDSLRQIAGFNLFRRSSSKTSNPTTQGANLRGVSGSGAARTAVQFDGLSLNDAFGGWTYWSRVPQVAVEQVEVFRGGASSLYGSGGLSGAVDLITIAPDENAAILIIQTSAGSQHTFDGSVFGGFSKKSWTFDAAIDLFKTDGYITVAEAERGEVDSNANSQHKSVIAGVERKFGSSPQKRGVTDSETHGRLFARGNLFSEDRENGTTLTTNGTYFRQIAIGGDLENTKFGRFELRTFLQGQVYDQTFSAVSADRNIETLTRLQRVPSQAAGGNLFWTRAFGDHSVASSVEFRDVRGFSDEVGFGSGSPTSVSRSGGRERTVALFAQDLWRVSESITLSFGGRYDRWQNSNAHTTIRNLSTNVVTTTVFADRKESSFSPRIAALVSATQSVSLYGSYSRSFRAPTLNELYRGFRVGNVVTLANENLAEETADTFEAGAGYRRRSFALRGNAFVTTVTDPVVNITLSSTPALITRQRRNVGGTRSRGIELDAEFEPGPEIRFSAGYLYVDPRITAFPTDQRLVGNFLPQVPRHQVTFQLRYIPTKKWLFGIQARASSGQFEDDANTLWLRPYFTADANAAYMFNDHASAFMAVENIFNNRYDIGLTPNSTVASPAFVRVGLRLNLGKR